MYGKCFSSMYEGSMVGAGPVVFAVWGYCIAKADLDGTVLLNPDLLAPVIGTSREEIVSAIQFLMKPDAHSKNPEHEGRRLLHQSGHLYFLVSHHIYREFKSNNDRREYMRKYMEEKRKGNVNINKVNKKLTQLTPASASASVSASDSEGGCKGGVKVSSQKYGELGNVLLTNEEHDKLKSKHKAEELAMGIEILDSYLAQPRNAKRYKNHYAVLKETSWVWDRVKEKIVNQRPRTSDLDKRLAETECKIQEALS